MRLAVSPSRQMTKAGISSLLSSAMTRMELCRKSLTLSFFSPSTSLASEVFSHSLSRYLGCLVAGSTSQMVLWKPS